VIARTAHRFTVDEYYRMAETGVINLPEQKIEVYREPHYTGYASKTYLKPGDTACPSAFPDVNVEVAALLRQAG
jgi:hypothetical protein